MSLFDADQWREIGNVLKGNKVRTTLTAFGVFWGIFLLMVMMGSGNGLERGAMQEFAGSATNAVYVWGQRTSKPFRGLPIGRRMELAAEDVDALRRGVPEAEIICPRCQGGGYGGGNNVTRGTKSGGFGIMGDTPDLVRVQSVPLTAGRFVNRIDLEDHRKVAVIGTRVHELLFAKGEDPIGKELRIQGVSFAVVGVFKSVHNGRQGEEESQTIHIPLTTFQQAFNYGRKIDWLAVKSRDDVAASVAEKKVKDVLKERHRVAPDDQRAFGSWNTEEEFKKFHGLFVGIRLLVWIVGIGTLTAGVIGVSNIMLVIVRERTRELGIRRAVGATPATITGQIVLEALLLTSSAGYIGLISGMLLVDLIAFLVSGQQMDFFKSPGVEISTALQALGILVAAGIVAGIMPAWRAVRVTTVEALRA